MNGDNSWMFQRGKLDSAYSGLDRGYNSRTGQLAPLASNGPVNAVNRSNGFISSPSGTDWARTFGRNPRLNDNSSKPAASGDFFAGRNGQSKTFDFNLSPASDQSQLKIGTDATDFYKDRTANMDLTKKDHELYGAGSDYGFGY